jgi:hypothetical protein
MLNDTVDAVAVRIKRTSRVAAAALGVTVIAVPGLLALFAYSGLISHIPELGQFGLSANRITPAARLVIFVTMLGTAAPLMWGGWELRRLFLGYAAGEVFTEIAAARFGRFAAALILTGLAGPLRLLTLSAGLSWLDVIPHALIIAVSSNDIMLILAGCMLRIVASVLRGAASLAEENALFF